MNPAIFRCQGGAYFTRICINPHDNVLATKLRFLSCKLECTTRHCGRSRRDAWLVIKKTDSISIINKGCNISPYGFIGAAGHSSSGLTKLLLRVQMHAEMVWAALPKCNEYLFYIYVSIHKFHRDIMDVVSKFVMSWIKNEKNNVRFAWDVCLRKSLPTLNWTEQMMFVNQVSKWKYMFWYNKKLLITQSTTIRVNNVYF